MQQFERHAGKLVTTSVGDAAARKDFHRLEDTDHSLDPFAVEKMFAQVEALQARSLQQALGNPELLGTNLALRAEMLGFLQMMFFRVPKVHEMLANATGKALEAGMRILEKHGRFADMPPELQRHFNGRSVADALRPKPKNWFLILNMLRQGNSRELYNLLWPRSVAVLVASGFRGFVAGDAAVAIYDCRHDKTPWKASGFASPTAEFSFPLSPRMMLLVSNGISPGVVKVSDDEVRYYNRRTIVWSERFLFAETFDAVTLRDIMQLSGRQAGFSTENLDAPDGIFTISRMVPVHPALLERS